MNKIIYNNIKQVIQQFSHECTEYMVEADCTPVYKALKTRKEPISRVKLRRRSNLGQMDKLFDIAFESENDVRKRSLISHSNIPETDDGESIYCVFPINGYDYLFNERVESLTREYEKVMASLQKNEVKGTHIEVLADLLQNNYRNDNLDIALSTGCEIMFYNIPYYYAIERDYFVENQIVITSLFS